MTDFHPKVWLETLPMYPLVLASFVFFFVFFVFCVALAKIQSPLLTHLLPSSSASSWTFDLCLNSSCFSFWNFAPLEIYFKMFAIFPKIQLGRVFNDTAVLAASQVEVVHPLETSVTMWEHCLLSHHLFLLPQSFTYSCTCLLNLLQRCMLSSHICPLSPITPPNFRLNLSHSSRVRTPVQKPSSPPRSAFIRNDSGTDVGHFLTSIQSKSLPWAHVDSSTSTVCYSSSPLSTHSFLALCLLWGFNLIAFIAFSGSWSLEPLCLTVRYLRAVWQWSGWFPPLIVKSSLFCMLFDLVFWTCSLHPL